jgi:hypothetical protein
MVGPHLVEKRMEKRKADYKKEIADGWLAVSKITN